MVGNIMGAIQGVLLVLMLIGLICGLVRGFSKSLIRLVVVLAIAVITFFVTKSISKAILEADFSKQGWEIAGVSVTSAQDTIVSLIQRVPVIEDLTAASPTFKALITAIPLALLNLVVFVLAFFIFKLFSHIISLIAYKVILKKVPKEEKGTKNKYRLLGGAIGILQSVIVFAVFAVPVFGIMNIGQMAVNNMKKEETTTTVAETAVSKTVIANTTSTTFDLDQNIVATTENEISSGDVDKIVNEAEEYVNSFNKLAFVKVFRTLGIGKLSEKVFDNFTTMNINNEKVVLSSELNVGFNLYGQVDDVKKVSWHATENECNTLKTFVNTSFDSKLISNITGEIVPYVAEEWKEGDSAFSLLSKPNVPSQVAGTFDEFLTSMETANAETIHNDLLSMIDLYGETGKNGTLKLIADGADSTTIMKKLGETGLISGVVGAMAPSDTLRNILPTVVQAGFNYIYPALDIPETKTDLKSTFYSSLAHDVANATGDTDEETKENMKIRFAQTLENNGFGRVDDTYITAMAQAYFVSPAISFEAYFELHACTVGEETFKLNDMTKSYRKTKEDMKITKMLSKEEWDTEKVHIEGIFGNLVRVLVSVENVEAGHELESIDFAAFGAAFNHMRTSLLLNDSTKATEEQISFNIASAMLRSKLMKNISVPDSFVNSIEDKWDDGTVNFEEMFDTLRSATIVMSAYKDGGANAEQTEDLLKALTGDNGQDVVDVITTETLALDGTSEEVAQSMHDLMQAISEQDVPQDMTEEQEADYYEKESNILNGMLDVLETSNDDDSSLSLTDPSDVAGKTKAQKLVDDLMASDLLYRSMYAKTVQANAAHAADPAVSDDPFNVKASLKDGVDYNTSGEALITYIETLEATASSTEMIKLAGIRLIFGLPEQA